jgi:hypothetical protein
LRSPRSDLSDRGPNHFPGKGPTSREATRRYRGSVSGDFPDITGASADGRVAHPCGKNTIASSALCPARAFAHRDSCASVAGWRRIGVEGPGLTSASSRAKTLTSSVSGEIRDWHDHCDEHTRIGKDCMRGKLHDVNSLPQSTKATDAPKPPGTFPATATRTGPARKSAIGQKNSQC